MNIKKQINKMIEEIERETAYTSTLIGKDKLGQDVMQAMRTVPRHEFVPVKQQRLAYMNGPLMIGCGQTISQPFIVALMADLLNVDKNSVILDIGTGSGYAAAVLSRLAKMVYTMEVIPELLESARQKFDLLGYKNIEARLGDGYIGWPEHAPYDGIIVSAAASEIPAPLTEQLKPGASLVIPVGTPHGQQELIVARKDSRGVIAVREILAVAFVPLVKTSQFFYEET